MCLEFRGRLFLSVRTWVGILIQVRPLKQPNSGSHHGLPDKWEPYLQEGMRACGSDLQSTLHMVLPADLLEIHFVSEVGVKKRPPIQVKWRNDDVPFEEIPCLFKITNREYLRALNNRGFWCICLWHQ